MKRFVKRLLGDSSDQLSQEDLERQAAEQIRKATQEARRGQSAFSPGESVGPSAFSPREPERPGPSAFSPREPERPAPSAFSPGEPQRPGPSTSSPAEPQRPGQSPFPAVPSAPAFGPGGESSTPDDERQAVTAFAMEQLAERGVPATQRWDVGAGDVTPAEAMRDRALQEIIDRKARLDREWRERHARDAAQTGQPAKASQAAKAGQPAEAQQTGTAGATDARRTLGQISGLGPAKQDALLERFGSIEAIRAAGADDLTEVKGVGPALATRIKSALK